MANNLEDDDLLRDLIGNLDSSPNQSPAASKKNPEPKVKLETALADALPVKKYSVKNLLNQLNLLKVKLKNSWALPFMIGSIIAAIFVWGYLPQTISEEDQIHEPGWWFQRALHYYDIAEDKGLQVRHATGEFSRFEFGLVPFEEQKEIYERIKDIKGFPANPNLTNPSQFLSTFVNDLNKLIIDESLYEKLPPKSISKINKEKLEKLKEEIKKTAKASENSNTLVFFNSLKLLNRELLNESFKELPANKPARIIAAKYFRYIYDEHPKFLKTIGAADQLKLADSFAFVLGENISDADKLNAYLESKNKNDPKFELEHALSLGGPGEQLLDKSIEDTGELTLEDQAHVDYMLANLYYEKNDNSNSQKYFKRFLDLALEKGSEGFERRVEKDIFLFNLDKKRILHRELNQQKINDAYFKLGGLQFKNNEFEDSKQNLEQYLSKSLFGEPEKIFYANQILGDMYLALKNYDKALLFYQKSLNINAIPLNQMNPVKYKTGLANYRLGEYEKAIERFKLVNGSGKFGNYNSSALFYTGKSYQLLGEEEKSIDLFKLIKKRFPASDEDMAATLEIAKYHFKKGLYDIAFSEPLKGNQGEKYNVDYSVKTLLEYPIERFLNNEFINVAEIIVQPDSNSQEIGLLYDLAKVFTAKKQYEKAINVYTLMTSNPLAIKQMGAKRDKLYFDMAKIWSENGAPIRAGETLELMLEKIPDTPFYAKALWDVCKYYMSKNDYARAIKPLRRFTYTFYERPETAESYYLLGICEQKVGDFEQAIAAYNKAYGYIPFDSNQNNKSLEPNAKPEEDPYYVLNRPENAIDRNFFAYQAIYQKGEFYKDVGLYDLAIDHIYRTVFNDPLFRFSPSSEIWRKSALIYADSYFNKGWQEKLDLKLKKDYFNNAEKKYLDYIERYKIPFNTGLGSDFDQIQKLKWEEFDKTNFAINYNLGYIKFEQKEFEKAREYYLKIIKWPMNDWTNVNRDEKKKDAFLMLPLTYFKEGKWEEALTAYRDAKDRYATSTEAPALGMRIAECLQNMGDFTNAKLEFDASKWALELASTNLFNNKPGAINKKYWDDLISLKKSNLEWVQSNKTALTPP